jgi:midasin (ATPase involved in ribosome maturation)
MHESKQPSELPSEKVVKSKPSSSRLVLTPTTKANLEQILAVCANPIHLLLEGSSGVGKSATIDEAAAQTGKKLERFNMSSRVNIDDLLGKVTLETDPKGMKSFKFASQPFTRAFGEGHWLLLDELNLAQDTVLQCIEGALDTKVLRVPDGSSADSPCKVVGPDLTRIMIDFGLFMYKFDWLFIYFSFFFHFVTKIYSECE